ncbi:MAG TPA: malectin domain-containing carbohydrate-binding protein [Terriglobia bacterium]|nr:malectin domain-containing carbohydrate-binding protein [Terriglobia bacterium]
MSSSVQPQQREFELQSVLSSKTFTKTPNLARLLQYVCNKSFEGRAGDLKEYNIGVEALGRPPEFDPTNSSIVRVEFYRLREKLKKYYETEGRNDAITILLEPGSYAPQFVPALEIQMDSARDGTALPQASLERPLIERAEGGQLAIAPLEVGPLRERVPALPDRVRPLSGFGLRMTVLAIILVVLAGMVVAWKMGYIKLEAPAPAVSAAETPGPVVISAPGEEVRILAGYSKNAYIDRYGRVWEGDRYFKGGTATSIARQFIARTLDPGLFQSSRSGEFSYDIPRKAGVYELHLYFVESIFGPGTIPGGGESSRIFNVLLNGQPLLTAFDPISDAGANNTADERVFKDVTPAPDGYIHLAFRRARDEPIITAIEIIPGIPGKTKPLRIVAQDNSFTDHTGQLWSPDCYFRGGRAVVHKGPVQFTQDPDLYDGERFGNFDYSIPVAKGKYAVKLHFSETYFGPLNPGGGGVGSRVFEVFCNGVALLRNFDISKEAGGPNRALVKVFHGLEPNAEGKLIISFVPIANYACINAIEVAEE